MSDFSANVRIVIIKKPRGFLCITNKKADSVYKDTSLPFAEAKVLHKIAKIVLAELRQTPCYYLDLFCIYLV